MSMQKVKCLEMFKLRFVFLSEVTFISMLNGEIMEATQRSF